MEAEIVMKRMGESIAINWGKVSLCTRKYIVCDFELINLASERFSYIIRLEDSATLVYQ